MKISYLGPSGTYSEEAVIKLAKLARAKIFCPEISLEAVARKVKSGEVDLGVMAYYNYLEGLVQECLDLIYDNKLSIVACQRIPIKLSLGKYYGSSNYGKIYSHPKALAQCSEWLSSNYPKSILIETESTADAAGKVKETKSGIAIASENALKKNDLEIVAENIGNKRHENSNYTDFYLVSKAGNNYGYKEGKEYLTMVAITPHCDKAGLLAEILGKVAKYRLNNAKIHSRPALDNVKINNNGEPQMFYLEIVCHKDNKEFQECLKYLKNLLNPENKTIEVVRVLGSYERAHQGEH